MNEALASLLDHVRSDADALSPTIWANIFGMSIQSDSCVKCKTLLPLYTRLKIALHHAKRFECPKWIAMPDGNTLPAATRLAVMAADARSAFYNCPCVCGRRKEYVIQ